MDFESRKWFKNCQDELITENPATDAICFHAQQCAEKYLKAYLVFNNKEIRKTHDIAELVKMCSEVDPDFNKLNQIDIISLTDYAVEVRYIDDFYFPSVDEARSAIEVAEKVKDFVVNKLKERGYEL